MRLSGNGRSGNTRGSDAGSVRRCTGWGASPAAIPTCLSCGGRACGRRVGWRSGMRRESHVRCWEGGGVRPPSATRRFAGGRGVAVEVAAERLQPDLVGEVGERELAQLLRGGLTRDPSAHDTRLAHRYVERARRDDDGGDRLVSIKRDELSGGAGVE